ncbi:MAG TPA: hypothetical protein VJV79_40310 [Polyangiaceae bacterium]|nr:hypothetical protein [Polyangiaceae bacterium]
MDEIDEAEAETVIEHGRVRFTSDRVEKVRNGRRVTSVARARTRSIRIRNQSASEHPAREAFWAVGIGAAAFFSLTSQSGKLSSWITGGALAIVSILLIRHQFTNITVVDLRGDDGRVRMDLEERLTDSEVDDLNHRLGTELGWPVDDVSGPPNASGFSC